MNRNERVREREGFLSFDFNLDIAARWVVGVVIIHAPFLRRGLLVLFNPLKHARHRTCSVPSYAAALLNFEVLCVLISLWVGGRSTVTTTIYELKPSSFTFITFVWTELKRACLNSCLYTANHTPSTEKGTTSFYSSRVSTTWVFEFFFNEPPQSTKQWVKKICLENGSLETS